MKCKACDGSGWDVVRGIDCISCDGKGVIKLSNEEYIRSCSRKELILVLRKFYIDGRVCDYMNFPVFMNKIEKWLQEEHEE